MKIHFHMGRDPRQKKGDTALVKEIFENYYREERKMYTREKIETCGKLMIKRCR